MRRLLIATLALGAMSVTPALAEPAAPPSAAKADTPTHEMCKSVMGRKMEPRQPHDHGRDKTGAATWPNRKPLTKAEMTRMHEQCAKKMAAAEAAKPKAAPAK